MGMIYLSGAQEKALKAVLEAYIGLKGLVGEMLESQQEAQKLYDNLFK